MTQHSPDQTAAERTGLIRLLNPLGRIWLRIVARVFEWSTNLMPSRLNFSWISSDLAVGGAPRKRDYRRLATMGISAVVDTREEDSDDQDALSQLGISLLHLPTEDRYALSQERLTQGAAWAVRHLEEGGKVFVHCQHGVGRGPLLGMAILISQGSTASEALRTIRTRRWQAAPNDRQLEALLIFEERWEALRAGPTP